MTIEFDVPKSFCFDFRKECLEPLSVSTSFFVALPRRLPVLVSAFRLTTSLHSHSMASRAPHAGQRLRSLMQKKCVMLPGAYNGLTARLAAEAGFEGVYVSGAALSACQGVPDIGILGLEDFTRVISQAASVTSLPVLADADTGFGGPEMVRRTVFAYNQAGAAGLHIEDQRLPKKCGHLEGKQLVSIEEMEEKIKAAAAASQDCSNGDFIICARTDARSVDGLDAAVERAVRYTAAGADMLFPEGLETEEEFQAFAHALAVLPGKAPFGGPYLLANMTEFGKTPIMELSTFEGLGYHCVIYPVSPLRVAMKSVKGMLVDLRKNGSVGHSLEKMYTRQELYSTLHYRPEGTWTYPSASVCMDKAVEDTEA
ncbi:carboxyvinyl-carboxyphosphonate phosphorylmutase [Toxoplasma gondii TgCatPRC2]|uniref:Carboxyvinyl-carboxyphosphonate phosphorylmutase n=10 Tax=Toxoplasma gondii TaxID=5811 RepID=V5B008_TOXGV|nr:carboxyvinyl-carboxyphosphonate phosphorylmutase [Toxoplasma gondii ME49]ABC59524.1 2-methylisocitrate lyase [Toxoplasma gondii]EPR57604.1 carboxyvinyl-carboxyphosphonate phosphorylmutase [Toxoplasma gondii GT1]ESS29275.1 carboxyvinyl-carboxyphosphonate phosphorylmutase [Toxoplasma gondii VEG]KFG35696.1 carboxyvinyl-carboxyphosphonate phosphorylmutase [Toxoplasma gondii p89]KFH14368.1 carboxyvinyl-carboxyphosphonate phosphorylmutase [Toxoplasma gondii MAS]KYK65932.1 carboxyvinyl-carboxypho|eukprot:XP_002370182.1 carboxyvinyl-carboxyphosphonate phosphorylmutase [Toxoplasma gondii ME49]